MNRTIHLVRHAEVDNPKGLVYASLPGFPLSPLGRRQAAETADMLAGKSPLAVVTSPLDRAVETASAIADAAGTSISIDERLTEWALAERWAGAAWDDLPAIFPGEVEAYLAQPTRLDFSSESIESVATRVIESVRDHTSSAGRGDVVFVSHQDPVQATRLSLTGRPLEDLHVDKPGHGSIVSLARRDHAWAEIEKREPAQGPSFPPADR